MTAEKFAERGARCDDGISPFRLIRRIARTKARSANLARSAGSFVVESSKYSEIVARRRFSTADTWNAGNQDSAVLHCGVATISHPYGNALAKEKILHPSIYDGVYAAAQVRAKCLSVSRSSYCIIKWVQTSHN